METGWAEHIRKKKKKKGSFVVENTDIVIALTGKPPWPFTLRVSLFLVSLTPATARLSS